MRKVKISLKKEELQIFCSSIIQGVHQVTFLTLIEQKLSHLIIKRMIEDLFQRLIQHQDKYKVTLNEIELIVLKEMLPQITAIGPYEETIMREIYHKIHQSCIQQNI